MSCLVFVYATLMHKRTLEQVFHHDFPIAGHAIVYGYKEYKEGTWPNLEKAPGEVLKGDLLQVTPEQLAKLDAWEQRYRRARLITTDGDQVWAYVLKGKT